MLVYRLCKERYASQVISGDGGLAAEGRWHSRGARIVCCATSEALAVLELRVHVGRFLPRAAFAMHAIEVPDEAIAVLAASSLPADWKGVPFGAGTRALGDEWLRSGRTLALRVPSIHAVSDANLLVNPLHPAAGQVQVVDRRPYAFDLRLF